MNAYRLKITQAWQCTEDH